MHYFLTPALSAGLFYKADFDLIRGTLPFKGFDVSGRWYPFGQGTYTSRRSGGTLLEFHENYAVYVGADFSERTYFLASDGTSNTSNLPSSTDVLEGGYAAANGGVGIDIRMSRHFEMNFEVMTTMFSFSGTDKTVKISSTMFNTGINYVW
ncbi:MAG: hypothetical protein JST16_06935 [Bdellovibrionales bacterium]|nr:hypothetical protein [Bdellovibrionales bacterium]